VEVQCEEVSHIPREEVPPSTVQTGSGKIHPLTSYGITGLPLVATRASAVLVCIAESASHAVITAWRYRREDQLTHSSGGKDSGVYTAIRSLSSKDQSGCDNSYNRSRTDPEPAELSPTQIMTKRTASCYPSADEINALPEKFRQYIHDLETRCDKSGDVQTLAILREDRDALLKRVEELEAEVSRLRST
jgi:hypothetical protein